MIQFLVAAPGSSPQDGGTMLDRDAAATFLREQADWLRRGLENACDHTTVTDVIATHDTFHRMWIELIAAVNLAIGEDAARAVSALYAFQGHIAGTLERGPDPRLEAGLCAEVRALLDEHLEHLTDAVVKDLEAPQQAQYSDQ